MRLILNGEEKSFGYAADLASLIDFLDLDFRKVAVELNREVVPRSRYPATLLADGDRIEIVKFVGGG